MDDDGEPLAGPGNGESNGGSHGGGWGTSPPFVTSPHLSSPLLTCPRLSSPLLASPHLTPHPTPSGGGKRARPGSGKFMAGVPGVAHYTLQPKLATIQKKVHTATQ